MNTTEKLNKPLVSLLIPCYNVERKVFRLFDSILNQTYNKFQIVIINDGSTDETESIINQYGLKFKERGGEFKYIFQDNKGVAKACEAGLPYIKGDYLCWPDADDFYEPTCIERLVNFLEMNKEYSLVRCNASVFSEKDLLKPIGTLAGINPDRFKENNLILDYIIEKNVYFAPICFMVRFSVFKEVNPHLYLFEGRTGQNYQMLLPLLYQSKFGYIDECLCNYIIYKGSISHIYHLSFHDKIKRVEDKHNCVFETLKRMRIPANEFKKYKYISFQKLYFEKCLTAYNYGKKQYYTEERPSINMREYVLKLSWPDRIVGVPFAFKVHSLFHNFVLFIKRRPEARKLYKYLRLVLK